MSVLNLIKKVKVQTLSFEKHPCRELEQEQMIHYLNGLALITNEDENICEKEQEYLSILINSFGLSEDMLETFVNFAQNPDEKLILDMMQSFMSKDIKYNFMIDAMMIASIDGNVHENEKALINEYFEMFKITKDEEKDLRDIYEMFYKQDGNALFRYFGKQHINDVFIIKKELFQYLIDYYKIDFKYELQKKNLYDKWNNTKQNLTRKKETIYFKEREIYWANIGENIGFEQNGKGDDFTRPLLIFKKFSKNIFFGIPLSTKKKNGSFFFEFSFQENKKSTALLIQTRMYDVKRLDKKIGKMTNSDFSRLTKEFKDLINL